MARLQKSNELNQPRFGIRILHPNGMVGWIVGSDAEPIFYPTQKEAQNKLKEFLADERYSWNCDVAVAEFKGYSPVPERESDNGAASRWTSLKNEATSLKNKTTSSDDKTTSLKNETTSSNDETTSSKNEPTPLNDEATSFNEPTASPTAEAAISEAPSPIFSVSSRDDTQKNISKAEATSESKTPTNIEASQPDAPKKRRPRLAKSNEILSNIQNEQTSSNPDTEVVTTSPPKKRGRPRKSTTILAAKRPDDVMENAHRDETIIDDMKHTA